ncbi:benzoate degradation ring-cleavage hydrolase [hydrothermal vent metagenome]|uniref:Benzoate degradation ring-cleavage hydrolase n=1 Tax=hydrothermal vent metagenome TaxID=652676 RepID=A0A3B0SZ05_9ZZZZ
MRSTIHVTGHQIECDVLNPDGEAPWVVFLHEGLGSIDLWRGFPADVAAATGRPVLVYNRHGHGFSDVLTEPRNVDFMHHEALVTFPEVLASFGIERPILVGHSDGASIALIYAGAGHPVAGIAAFAPHVFVEPEAIASIEVAKERFATTDLADRMARYHRDPTVTFRGWNDIWLDPEFEDWDITEYLPGISCPVLLVQGLDDEYGTLAQLDTVENALAGSVERLELSDCRHSPHLDRRQKTLEATTRFINTITTDG